MLSRGTTWRLHVILAVMVLFTSLTASAQNCVAPCVAGGSDELQTIAPTSVNLANSGTGFGVANLQSLPNLEGQCCVDTMVQRQEDAAINVVAIPIQIVDLSLIAPGQLNTNTFHYDIFVTLDPVNLPLTTGTETINGDVTGGTFTSCSTLYFEATFMPTDGGPAISPYTNSCMLGNIAPCQQAPTFTWTPTAPAGAYLATAAYSAFEANQHTMLPAGYVDFYYAQSTTLTCSDANGNTILTQTVQQAPAEAPGKANQHNRGSETKVRK